MITLAIIQNIATIIYFISTCVCVCLIVNEKGLWRYDREYLYYLIIPVSGAFLCWGCLCNFKDIKHAIAPAQLLFFLSCFVLILGSITNAIIILINIKKKYSKNKKKNRKWTRKEQMVAVFWREFQFI